MGQNRIVLQHRRIGIRHNNFDNARPCRRASAALLFGLDRTMKR